MQPDAPELTDAELIAQVRAGDVNAYEPLITRHREQVFAIAARHVPGAQVAETAQENAQSLLPGLQVLAKELDVIHRG